MPSQVAILPPFFLSSAQMRSAIYNDIVNLGMEECQGVFDIELSIQLDKPSQECSDTCWIVEAREIGRYYRLELGT